MPTYIACTISFSKPY